MWLVERILNLTLSPQSMNFKEQPSIYQMVKAGIKKEMLQLISKIQIQIGQIKSNQTWCQIIETLEIYILMLKLIKIHQERKIQSLDSSPCLTSINLRIKPLNLTPNFLKK